MSDPPAQQPCICALATPSGRGALSIIRLSGHNARALGEKITRCSLLTRKAHYTSFFSSEAGIIDQGIALYFQAPASFTGEDVVEFHCHGNPLIADSLLKTLCEQGARPAQAGEFSLRAFLNGKMDLVQAEAIADLIKSNTEQALRSATRSMQGAFSQRIMEVQAMLTQNRVHMEAHLDFPDEEMDRQQRWQLKTGLDELGVVLERLLTQARLGERLQSGATIVIAGKPNVGKSSLLNSLAQSEVAIVTEIPGTTRDPLSAEIEIKGVPVRLIDTAGLRDTQDPVEIEGVARAQQAVQQADWILWMTDVSVAPEESLPQALEPNKTIHVRNKIDLQKQNARREADGIYVSIKTQEGMEQLLHRIADLLMENHGVQEPGDTPFMARARHLVALRQALQNIHASKTCMARHQGLELAAEELRTAQQHLSTITGEFTTEDLLGELFAEFCVGK